MSIKDNREFVSQELLKLQDDVGDPRYRELWVQYHAIVMSLADDFFTIRPVINDDGHMSWSGLRRLDFVKLPCITYRIHHPVSSDPDPTLEVLVQFEGDFGGEIQFALFGHRVQNGKYNDVALLEHLKYKFHKWLFERL